MFDRTLRRVAPAIVLVVALAGSSCSGDGDGSAGVDVLATRTGVGLGYSTTDLSSGAQEYPGVTASGRASRRVPADRAQVQVTSLSESAGFPGGSGFDDQTRVAVVAALEPLGIDEAAVAFSDFSDYQLTVSVDVPVSTDRAGQQAVADAVGSVLVDPSSTVLFSLRSCDELAGAMGIEAVSDAKDRARALASGTGLEVGDPVAVSSDPTASSSDGYYAYSTGLLVATDEETCPLSSAGSGIPVALGSAAEVEVSVAVQVTFGVMADEPGEFTSYGYGSIKAPAGSAFLVALGSTGGLAPVRVEGLGAALVDAGFEDSKIEVDGGSSDPFGSGQPVVRVEVDVADIQTAFDRFEEVANDAFGQATTGVELVVADCGAAIDSASNEAVADATARTEAVAEAGGLELGAVGAVMASVQPGASGGLPCEPTPLSLYGSITPTLVAADAEPVVTMTAYASVSRAVEGSSGEDEAPTVVATGTASVTVAADEAWVTVTVGTSSEYGDSQALGSADRRRVRDELASRGFDGADVQLDNVTSSYGSPTTRIRVRVPVDEVAVEGKRILTAVEDLLGDATESGVRYLTTACSVAVDLAAKAALGDAEDRAAGLANAAGGHRGALVQATTVAVTANPSGDTPPCDDEPPTSYLYGIDSSLVAFDDPAEVEVRVGVQAAYELEAAS